MKIVSNFLTWFSSKLSPLFLPADGEVGWLGWEHLFHEAQHKSTMDTNSEFGLATNLSGTKREEGKSAAKGGTPKYECPECHQGFNSIQRFDDHVSKHEGLSLYQCKKCDTKFSHRSSLFRHGKTCWLPEHARSIYPCTMCDRTFNRKDKVKEHMIMVHNQPKYQCKYCHESFNVKSLYQEHGFICLSKLKPNLGYDHV